MRVDFLVENVENFLPILTKILPVHTQIPVLSNLLLEAETDGFYISATNLEIGVRVKIPAKIETRGATTVPGKQFIEILSSLPKDKISVSFEKEILILRCRGNKVVLQTITREEFPNIFDQKGDKVHTFQGEELKEIFSKLVFAVAMDESRPELTGILLSQKNDQIDLVATDGFRLSLKKIKNKRILEEGEKLILPARLIIEAMSLKSDKLTMYIYKKANQVLFEGENIILVGRLINGEFPNYERVIPSSSKTAIVADREDFMQKVRLSSVFARDAANVIKINVEDDKIKMHSRASGVGEGEVELEGKQDGDNNEIAFNVKFLSDLLRNLSEKAISMELSSAIEPALFKTEEDKEFLHIIMPVRVQE